MDLVDIDYYYSNNGDSMNDYYDYDYDDYYYYYNELFNMYNIMWYGGMSLFVINATWDMYWTFGRQKEWKDMIDQGYESDDEEVNKAYQQEERRSFYSALAFGTAASIELATNIFDIHLSEKRVTVITSHIYLLSAIFGLWGTTFSCVSIPTGLMLVGDILFAIGTVIDAVISYMAMLRVNNYIIAKWWCLSRTLWLINAVLYCLADLIILWYRHSGCFVQRKTNQDGNSIYTQL